MRVLILSPVVPFARNMGVKQAVMSDLEALLQLGADVTLVAYHAGNELANLGAVPVPTELLPQKPGSRAVRSLRSLLSLLPAAAERYYSAANQRQLRTIAKRVNPDVILLQVVTVTGWLRDLRRWCPRARIVYRAHDVMDQVGRHEYRACVPLAKPLFLREWRRWRRMERLAVAEADETWAITQVDRNLLGDLYNQPLVSHLPVSVDLDRYAKVRVEDGDPHTWLHLGTLDMRKSKGVLDFVQNVWPTITGLDDQARLVLGGKISFRRPLVASRLRHVGPVDSDLDFYRYGRISLNPQTIGSGLQIKSLVSLASSRVLVSRRLGVEGMGLQHGEHYWDLDRLSAQGELSRIVSDTRRNLEIARAGCQWVTEHHHPVATQRVLESLLGVTGSRRRTVAGHPGKQGDYRTSIRRAA